MVATRCVAICRPAASYATAMISPATYGTLGLVGVRLGSGLGPGLGLELGLGLGLELGLGFGLELGLG